MVPLGDNIIETAFVLYDNKGSLTSKLPGSTLDRPETDLGAVELLTGQPGHTDGSNTSQAKQVADIQNGLKNGDVITVECPGADPGSKPLSGTTKADPVAADHEYTVVAYDPTNGTITLRNPWGSNDNTYIMQHSGDDGITVGPNGELTMPISTFEKLFKDVNISGTSK